MYHHLMYHRSEALQFSPSGTVFKKNVTLQIAYNGSAARGNRAAIHKFNRQTLMWDEQPESVTSLTEQVVRVKTKSFSTYAVFQRPVPVPPPPVAAAQTLNNAYYFLLLLLIPLLVLGWLCRRPPRKTRPFPKPVPAQDLAPPKRGVRRTNDQLTEAECKAFGVPYGTTYSGESFIDQPPELQYDSRYASLQVPMDPLLSESAVSRGSLVFMSTESDSCEVSHPPPTARANIGDNLPFSLPSESEHSPQPPPRARASTLSV
jgi:hypothetical protein